MINFVRRRLHVALALVPLLLVPAMGGAQYLDETQGLFEISPSTVNRNTDQVIIEFKQEEIIEDVAVEEGDEEGICCELPEEERLASDICVNVICTETP
jgi:hypothetical protein